MMLVLADGMIEREAHGSVYVIACITFFDYFLKAISQSIDNFLPYIIVLGPL